MKGHRSGWITPVAFPLPFSLPFRFFRLPFFPLPLPLPLPFFPFPFFPAAVAVAVAVSAPVLDGSRRHPRGRRLGAQRGERGRGQLRLR